MKTTLYIIAALATSFVAAPAAAECTFVKETSTFACVDPGDIDNRHVSVDQFGVGGASHSAYEFEIFGWAYRGMDTNVYVITPDGGYHTVGHSNFCSIEGDGCSFETHGVNFYSSATGWQSVTLWESEGVHTLCLSGDHANLDCQELA